ncbi:hypothetical protein AVEN_187613-1 [Araneus ventricosus]|uniref:Uncharacterized protein n=1 Tax=Araneus ventricosus TaxID=182803 RepID=A0A4Y2S0P2_ARAVE|nr:hypothetical protein AVEN_187613-1 [Araneus ventricosus]
MQPQEENLNSITKSNASSTIDGQEAAEELGKFYSKESRLTFNREDKKVAKLARNLLKTCQQAPTSNHLFSDLITTSKLIYAIQQIDNKYLLDTTAFTDNFWKTLDHMIDSAFYTFLICRGRRAYFRNSGKQQKLSQPTNQIRTPSLWEVTGLLHSHAFLANCWSGLF